MSSEKRQLAIDFHVHVDERVHYHKIPSALRARGLDGAGILTHNDLSFARKITKRFKEIDKEKIYFAGVEIDTADGHIIAFGIDEEIPGNRSSEETIELIREQGGISIIPHPFMSHNSVGWKSYSLKADGMEFYNGFAKIFLNFPNIMAKVAFKHNNFSQLGGSDAHYHNAVGTCYSLVEITGEATEEKILEAVRNKKTKPAKKPLDQYDIMNFIKIIFTPKEGRKIVRFFDYF
ncbi:MAG: PHP-associated domain-containing protein [Candidatus Heimdallarchaeota archaeon]